MNERDHTDRLLGAWSDDPFASDMPPYVDELLAKTRRMHQRPAWTSPGRWLPMSVTLRAPVLAPPLRALAIALALLLALLAALAVVPFGASLLRLPATVRSLPANGLIAYVQSETGDIVVIDPVDGSSRTLIQGGEPITALAWSPDGARIAFLGGALERRRSLTVADADGRTLWTLPGLDETGLDETFAWSPDGSRIAVGTGGERSPTISVVSATDGAVLRELHVPTTLRGFGLRPDGEALLVAGEVSDRYQIYTLSLLDGMPGEPIVATRDPRIRLSSPAYSPDGARIAYGRATCSDDPEDDSCSGTHAYVVDADGTNDRLVVVDPRATNEDFAGWSPDGSRLLVERGGGRLGIATVDGGRPPVLVEPLAEGASRGLVILRGRAIWSPDGRQILRLHIRWNDPGWSSLGSWLVDPATGSATPTGWSLAGYQLVTWQPVAP